MNRYHKSIYIPAGPIPMPKPHEALASYMAEDKNFRGIGTALATRLSDRFGRYLRDALSECHSDIIEILGHDVAEATFATFETKSHEAVLIEWLEDRGVIEAVGIRTAVRIARCWGKEGSIAIKNNPYLLTAFLPWPSSYGGIWVMA